jgi:hypothetical protein
MSRDALHRVSCLETHDWVFVKDDDLCGLGVPGWRILILEDTRSMTALGECRFVRIRRAGFGRLTEILGFNFGRDAAQPYPWTM